MMILKVFKSDGKNISSRNDMHIIYFLSTLNYNFKN
jgi:hypothetical protein